MPPFLTAIFIAMIGASFGSFGSVILHRLPRGEDIVRKRSACPFCAHTLAWFELFPFASFVFLRGHCRHCHVPIPLRYPLLELVMATVFTCVFMGRADALIFRILLLLAAFFLILIAFHDFETKRIPDHLSIPVLVIGFLFQILRSPHNLHPLLDGLSGAAIPFAFFGFLWMVSRGKWIGSGDVILGVCMGLLLGVKGIIVALFLAYILGAIIVLLLLIIGKVHRGSHIPFGPFLVSATIISQCFGDPLLQYYLSLGLR